jgi:hypothetical protein
MEKRERGLVAAPAVIREELARNYEQARLLRRLLKVSEDAAIEERRRRPQSEAARPGGAAS